MRAFFVAAIPALFALATAARADIFRWEYVNPADPSQGKRESATLAPDGAGVEAVPGADLGNRNLTMAYLVRANLSEYVRSLGEGSYGFYISAANLAGTNLTRGALTDAHFVGTTLTDAVFTDADVHRARFDKGWQTNAGGRMSLVGTGITPAQLYSTASYRSQDLSGIGLGYNDLVGANFADQNLAHASFYGATLTDADFTGADVKGASFSRSRLFNPGSSTLYGTGITFAQLYSTASYKARDLSGIGFEYNHLAGGNFAAQDLNNVGFSGATLTGADFRDATLTSVYFNEATLTGASFRGANLSRANFHSATLTGADFTDSEVRGATFGSAITLAQLYSTDSYEDRDLTGIDLSYSNLSGGNFAGQNLTDANFFRAALTNADFTGAVVRGGNFEAFYDHNSSTNVGGLSLAQLYSTASYTAGDLNGTNFTRNQLAGGNFARQNLTNASFYSTTLTGADFRQANLTNANLASTTLAGADFTDSEVRGATFGSAITLAQLYSTDSYEDRDLTGIDLSYSNLSGGNFAGQNLTDASFFAATLTGAEFSGATVRGTRFEHTTENGFTAAQLYSTASYREHDLMGVNFAFNDLTRWNFGGQNLTHSNFGENVKIGDSLPPSYRVMYATLSGANFTAADTRGARYLELSESITTNLIWPDGHVAGLNLAAGQKMVAYPGVPIPVKISGGFSIAAQATFDLTDNAVIVDYTGASPSAAVRELILSGRGGAGLGKAWNGRGITSSTASTANTTQPESHAVGYAENAAMPLGPLTTFHGQAVDDTSILLAYTHTGDANLDGVVNDDDVTIVGASYAPDVANANWSMGDFDYNGFVDDDDVTLLGAFYDPSAAPLASSLAEMPAGGVAAVPEPGSLAIVGSAAAAMYLLVFRIRRHRRACL